MSDNAPSSTGVRYVEVTVLDLSNEVQAQLDGMCSCDTRFLESRRRHAELVWPPTNLVPQPTAQFVIPPLSTATRANSPSWIYVSLCDGGPKRVKPGL